MRRLVSIVVGVGLVAFGATADDPDVSVETASVGGSAITLAVHNEAEGTETLRVQVSVVVEGGVTQILTSGNLSVGQGGTSTVTLTAQSSIVMIGDDPEPIPPLP